MDWITEIITIVISSGTIIALFQYFNNKRKTKIDANKQELDEFKVIIDRWEQDNERLRKREDEMVRQIAALRIEVAELRNKIVLLESAHQDLPLPVWLKDTSGVMLALNRAYEETFLVPRGYSAADYIGKKDSAVWPKETAEQFERHDKMVLRTGRVWHGIESLEVAPNDVEDWSIIKYVRYSGRTKIGIAGIAIPKHYKK